MLNRVRTTLLVGPLAALALAVVIAGCGASTGASADPGQIAAVGAENEYANLISQIGGKYVSVNAIESNPNTDPHTFEASPSVAQTVAAARLVVQNGLGYDTYMNKIESAQPSAGRKVIDVQKLLGLPDSTPNPHLWYRPKSMPALAHAVARDLAALQPSHADYFEDNELRFDASLTPYYYALKWCAKWCHHAAVAVTEPVADYMLEAAGTTIVTPYTLQADVMNGVDLAPQAVTQQNQLFSQHRVRVLLYNQQVTDSVTQSFIANARRAGIPVVGVYETMPTGGYNYQSWMTAEVQALVRAIANRTSTERLK